MYLPETVFFPIQDVGKTLTCAGTGVASCLVTFPVLCWVIGPTVWEVWCYQEKSVPEMLDLVGTETVPWISEFLGHQTMDRKTLDDSQKDVSYCSGTLLKVRIDWQEAC